ncbi:hypothetical protein MPSEU_000607700 [Mayamaea pseudoterrestris]|nr:hypothetical protein MPSEU_000607700 [Mayamaea pseudoterrestris]
MAKSTSKVPANDSPDYHAVVEKAIPSEFNMLSAADDSQEAQEAYNTSQFELPNANGKSGGCCTSALLQVLYDNAHRVNKLSWIAVLKQMRMELKKQGYKQEPQVSSSRPLHPEKPLNIVPPNSGRRRALLIGINYVGQGAGELKAPQHDCLNIRQYLIDAMGFQESQMLVLMDDGKHAMPTRSNIEKGFEAMVKYSQPNDVVFISFSGHGGNVKDDDGDEDDGMDESIIPVDFREAGQIVDDDILKYLIKPMRKGVHCTLIMDCCHSGTVADLPYKMGADDQKMSLESNFDQRTAEEMIADDTSKEQARMGGDTRNGGNGGDFDKDGKPSVAPPLPYNPADGIPIIRHAAVKKEEAPPPPPPGCCQIM